MSARPATPDELRMEAHAVLDRLRRLDAATRDGQRLTVDAVDAVTGALAELQRRIEVTARHYNHTWALRDVVAARRHLDEARMVVLRLLSDLTSG